jgi:hypothetical protein
MTPTLEGDVCTLLELADPEDDGSNCDSGEGGSSESVRLCALLEANRIFPAPPRPVERIF